MELAGRVTVVCIAYNHGKWIGETLESVRLQDYPDVELIVVDNGSTDDTAAKIREWAAKTAGFLAVQTIFYGEPQPYCQLFNRVIAELSGQFLIDLSGDDVLYPQHLSASVAGLQRNPSAGFSFSNANLLAPSGAVNPYYRQASDGNLVNVPDLEDLYATLIRRSCICSPTVVFNASILRKEGGYDESLFYEDFDIQIRLARNHPAVFSDHVGVLKRIHVDSMSAAQYFPSQSRMLPSTVRVCWKIRQMNRSEEENRALAIRILFELKHALWSANFEPARSLVQLGKALGLKTLDFRIYRIWAKMGWDISWLYLKLK